MVRSWSAAGIHGKRDPADADLLELVHDVNDVGVAHRAGRLNDGAQLLVLAQGGAGALLQLVVVRNL